jgi:putative SOS response-associated peptidase YedK
MCGRFVAATPPADLAAYFSADFTEERLDPSYNVAPTDPIYGVVATANGRQLQVFRWGLVPMWAKDIKIGSKLINARAETLTTRHAFQSAFGRRRVLLPLDGFFEWKALPHTKTKQPMFIRRLDGEPMAVAGLWESWRDRGGNTGVDGGDGAGRRLHSATLITVRANAAMETVHDRMPAILPVSAWAQWLDPGNQDLDSLGALLVPSPDELLTMRPVSNAVNNVRNNGPELIDGLDPASLADAGRLEGL